MDSITKDSSLMSFPGGLERLAEAMLARRNTTFKGDFWEFLRDVWSKGYTRPELFSVWHVGTIAEDLEKALQDKKHYCLVLPRGFLKSTIGYAFVIYRFLKAGGSWMDSSSLYLSFSDQMSAYHIAEAKKAIRRNPFLAEWMRDRVPNSDFSFRYYVNGTQSDLLHGGVFSFKRGTHVNRCVIADDLLRDPESVSDIVNYAQLQKVERHFYEETMYIPNEGAILVVMGTTMADGDLLTKLKSDEQFIYRFLPAIDPTPTRHILCPELVSESQLMAEQKSNPRAFASQRMLAPLASSSSYFSESEIKAIENPLLVSLNPDEKHELDSDFTVAGFDVGKKRHPSHLSVFISKGPRLKQVLQCWLDGWDYTRQVDFLNRVTANFGIDKGCIDNTRGEMEERGLDAVWHFMSFTEKSKRMMANVFEKFVNGADGRRIELIPNERQRLQIVCVDNELRAPETPLGHGDAFFSIALALQAFNDGLKLGVSIIDDISDMTRMFEPEIPQDDVSKVLSRIMPQNQTKAKTCPRCGEIFGWVEESKLCLHCRYKER